jgi:GDP-4-dehydro-6-deoxy-D-mannose reductase
MTSSRTFHRVLITGIAGSGGSYLAEYICQNHPEVEVHGISRWHSASRDNLANVRDQIQLHEADLNDMSSTLRAVQAAQPDAVFHLAAHANVHASFKTPAAVLENNILGTCHLFEALRFLDKKPWVQLCSTSEVYGQVRPEDVPIKEDCPMRPASPYAVSKVAQDLLGFSYWTSYQMPIIRTRMFSYINPRRKDLFATSFARQVARVEAGYQEEITHGNLDSVRTLIDVRDAMRAYWDAILYCEPGETYNIGGTTTMKVGDFLETLIKLAKKPIPHRIDERLLRPADVTLQIPCNDKFISATNWSPRYTFDESIEHLLNYWRQRVHNEAQRA